MLPTTKCSGTAEKCDELARVTHSVDPIAALGSTGQGIRCKSLPHARAAWQGIDVGEVPLWVNFSCAGKYLPKGDVIPFSLNADLDGPVRF